MASASEHRGLLSQCYWMYRLPSLVMGVLKVASLLLHVVQQEGGRQASHLISTSELESSFLTWAFFLFLTAINNASPKILLFINNVPNMIQVNIALDA
jgi:hypothetical protein